MTPISTDLLTMGVAKEFAYGTAVAPTTYPIVDPSSKFEMVHQPIEHKGKAGSRAELQKTSAGPESVKGTIKFRLEPENAGEILGAFFGSDTVTDLGSGAYQHDMVAAEASQTESLTISVDRGAADGRHNYVGCVPDKLTFEGDDSGAVSLTCEMMGKDEEDGSALTPTISDLEPFVFHMTAINLNGSTLSCKKWKITLANNVKLQRGIQGGGVRTPQSYIVGVVSADFEASIVFENNDLRDAWKAATVGNFTVTLTGDVVSGSNNYQLVLELTKVIFGAGEFSESDGAIGVEVKGNGIYDRDAGALITATLVNSVAAAY